jgi:hypothetical protein
MTTKLLQKRRQPVRVDAGLFPMGIAGSANDIFASPHWRRRALSRATGIGDWADELFAMGDTEAVGTVYALLYLPPATLAGAALGEYAHIKWQPCMEALADEIIKIDPSARLQAALHEKMRRMGVSSLVALDSKQAPAAQAAERELNSVLLAEIQRIQVQECEKRNSFCIEMAVRVRLLDVEKDRLLFDRIFVYSGREQTGRDWELVVAPSPCREISAYCGEAGLETLGEELARGIDSVVNQICATTQFKDSAPPHRPE